MTEKSPYGECHAELNNIVVSWHLCLFQISHLLVLIVHFSALCCEDTHLFGKLFAVFLALQLDFLLV